MRHPESRSHSIDPTWTNTWCHAGCLWLGSHSNFLRKQQVVSDQLPTSFVLSQVLVLWRSFQNTNSRTLNLPIHWELSHLWRWDNHWPIFEMDISSNQQSIYGNPSFCMQCTVPFNVEKAHTKVEDLIMKFVTSTFTVEPASVLVLVKLSLIY